MSRIRLWSLTLLAIGCTSQLHAQSSARARAWSFTYTVTGSILGAAKDTAELVFDVAIWRGVARVAVRRGPLRALTGERGLVLVRSADSTVVVLNPAKQEALVAQSGDLAGLFAGPMGSVQLDVTDAASVSAVRGAGPRLLGYATRHVDLTQRYALHVANGSVARSLRTGQVLQLDLSRDVARLDPGFRAFNDYFARSLGVPGAVRRALRTLERSVPVGFPLQILTTSHTVAGTDTLRADSRSVVTMLRADVVDTATFTIPPGYRITDMSRLLQSRPRPAVTPPRTP